MEDKMNEEFGRYISAQARQMGMLYSLLRDSVKKEDDEDEGDCHRSPEDGCNCKRCEDLLTDGA